MNGNEKTYNKKEPIDLPIGEHVLSGFEYTSDDYGYEACVFIIDGKTYIAVEDEHDGYRSTLDGVFETTRKCANNVNIKICIEYCPGDIHFDGYVFKIHDKRFKEATLAEIGTDFSNWYYPCCVMSYRPENIEHIQ